MDAMLAPWSGHAQLTSLLNKCQKKIINQISQGTFLKGVFLCRRLHVIISTSLEECDHGNLRLSIVSIHWSLLIICHKGFQSHFITSIFLTLAILNSLTHLTTKLNLWCLKLSLCSFFVSLNCCKHLWYFKNSCKELANDYVLTTFWMLIVWETEIATSSPCLNYIRPNSENCINIHITNIWNIQKMDKK
jgi:hypothetical protein